MPSLTELDRELCDSKLNMEECTTALKQLANNKSPGSDGFTNNFYKVFWIDLKDLIFNSFIYSQWNGLLTQNQKLGIINLIKKKEKDLRYLKKLASSNYE